MTTAGKHRGKAREWAVGKAGTGTPQIGIEFDLLDYPGETITYYGPLTEAALPYTLEAMRTCGWEGDDLTDLQGLDRNEVQLVVENETYNGKASLKVKFINRSGGLAMKDSLAGDELSQFAAMMRKNIREADVAAGRKPVARQPGAAAQRSAPARQPAPQRRAPPPAGPVDPEPPPIGDDDIPF